MSKTAYNLTLSLPPSVNGYWGLRIIQSSKTKKNIPVKYLTHKAREYRDSMENQILKQHPNFHPLHGPLQAAIVIHPATRRKEDIDNRLKPLFDALQGVLFADDEQIKTLRVEMSEPESPGYIHLILMEKS